MPNENLNEVPMKDDLLQDQIFLFFRFDRLDSKTKI